MRKKRQIFSAIKEGSASINTGLFPIQLNMSAAWDASLSTADHSESVTGVSDFLLEIANQQIFFHRVRF